MAGQHLPKALLFFHTPGSRHMTAAETLTTKDIAGLCDHTFLSPSETYRHQATPEKSAVLLRRQAFQAFLEETVSGSFLPYAICVRTPDVPHARKFLPDSIILAATVGFPDGPWHTTSYKVAETEQALATGATEIDMVMDYEALKNGNVDQVRQDITAVAEVVRRHKGLLKVILEISELSLSQTRLACEILAACDVAFVKTSTGFGSHGATAEHLQEMRTSFPRGIKISGGVNLQNVHTLLRAASTPGKPIPTNPMLLRIGESSLLQQV